MVGGTRLFFAVAIGCAALENKISGWKNVLFGDGHVESRRAKESSFSADATQYINTNPGPDEIQPRWGPSGSPQMW